MPLIPKPPKPMNLPSLLNWMLLGTALLGAWWACYCLALRPGRSFGYNRAFLGRRPLLAAALPLGLLRLAAGLGRLWWHTRGLPRMAAGGYTLIETHGRLPTSSFGRVIFWDENLPLSPVEARQVLAHERACQCRVARRQRNHIALAMRAWTCLKQGAYPAKKIVYQLKKAFLDEYRRHELRQPTLAFA